MLPCFGELKLFILQSKRYNMITELLAKAQENIKSAELSFEGECYNASANRAYYAAIHAAAAAIFYAGVNVDIDHRKIKSVFSTTLVNARKLYPSQMKDQLNRLQRLRNVADYDIESVSKSKATEQLSTAKKFVSTILSKVQS
ncbi:MAG: HEPN domain-containing protein [Candidatus Kapaibacterium sp.]|nr:MAG: HEPN domain-containing protein [Candidatus Kapabacteria bacterium]